jgi:hypothetical protein
VPQLNDVARQRARNYNAGKAAAGMIRTKPGFDAGSGDFAEKTAAFQRAVYPVAGTVDGMYGPQTDAAVVLQPGASAELRGMLAVWGLYNGSPQGPGGSPAAPAAAAPAPAAQVAPAAPQEASQAGKAGMSGLKKGLLWTAGVIGLGGLVFAFTGGEAKQKPGRRSSAQVAA